MCRKSSRRGRRSAWVSRALLSELTHAQTVLRWWSGAGAPRSGSERLPEQTWMLLGSPQLNQSWSWQRMWWAAQGLIQGFTLAGPCSHSWYTWDVPWQWYRCTHGVRRKEQSSKGLDEPRQSPHTLGESELLASSMLVKTEIWWRAGSSFSAEGSLQPRSSATASSCWCEFQARVAAMTPLRKPVPLACYRQAVNAYSVSAYLLAVKELFSCSQLPAAPDLGVSVL